MLSKAVQIPGETKGTKEACLSSKVLSLTCDLPDQAYERCVPATALKAYIRGTKMVAITNASAAKLYSSLKIEIRLRSFDFESATPPLLEGT